MDLRINTQQLSAPTVVRTHLPLLSERQELLQEVSVLPLPSGWQLTDSVPSSM